jgi:hypothetical protein
MPPTARSGEAAWRAVLLSALALLLIPVCVLFAAQISGQQRAVPAEVEIRRIPLEGPVTRARAEISGLAWYEDTLILLPQYPERMVRGPGGVLFSLPKTDLLTYLDGETDGPFRPLEIPFEDSELRREISGYEGYEAIAFHGSTAFLTIEASPGSLMKSYLVRGEMEPDLSRFTVQPGALVEVPLDVQINNFSSEALLIDGERVVVFYEAVGAAAASQIRAYIYDFDLNLTGYYLMPPLEYRLTDATTPDAAGRFWVSNFFFPLDLRIFTRDDALFEQFGRGPTHAAALTVERLVELQLPRETGGEITFSGAPPIQLKLARWGIPRNWEGIVRLDERGFLLATDKFPETILAFVGFE